MRKGDLLAQAQQDILTARHEHCRMAEIRTVATLGSNRVEIRNTFAEYERRLAQPRADLASVTAWIRLFDLEDVTSCRIPPYGGVHRLNRHRELGR